jgi:hypothetical protein
MTISNAAVPLVEGRPRTMLPEGEVRSSKSPCNAASDMNDAVVSKEALRSGELLVDIPLRLKGL